MFPRSGGGCFGKAGTAAVTSRHGEVEAVAGILSDPKGTEIALEQERRRKTDSPLAVSGLITTLRLMAPLGRLPSTPKLNIRVHADGQMDRDNLKFGDRGIA